MGYSPTLCFRSVDSKTVARGQNTTLCLPLSGTMPSIMGHHSPYWHHQWGTILSINTSNGVLFLPLIPTMGRYSYHLNQWWGTDAGAFSTLTCHSLAPLKPEGQETDPLLRKFGETWFRWTALRNCWWIRSPIMQVLMGIFLQHFENSKCPQYPTLFQMIHFKTLIRFPFTHIGPSLSLLSRRNR